MSSDFELVSWWMNDWQSGLRITTAKSKVPIQQFSASLVTGILKIQARLKVCDILPYWAIKFEKHMIAFCHFIKKNSIIIEWLFAWNFYHKTNGVNLLISFSVKDPEKESVNFYSISIHNFPKFDVRQQNDAS